MKRISPIDKLSYARLFASMQKSEDKEELRQYAANMRKCADLMDTKAKELERRAELMKYQQ